MTTNRYKYFIKFYAEEEDVGDIMFTRYDYVTRTCVYFLKNGGSTIFAPLSIRELENMVALGALQEAEIKIFHTYLINNPHKIFVLKYNSGIIKVFYFSTSCNEYDFLSSHSVEMFLEKDLNTLTEEDINETIRIEKLHLFIHKLNPLNQIMVSEYRLSIIKQMYDLEGFSLSEEFNEIPLGYIVINDAIMNNTFIQMYL